MLKKRVVAVLVVHRGVVVQSIGFRRYLPVGSPEVCVEFLSRWGIDEIILLDIDATPEGRAPCLDQIARVSKRAFVPLTVGGGIRTLEDIRALVHSGADKVSINDAALRDPGLVTVAASKFGSQSVVASIDVRRHPDGRYEVFAASGSTGTGRDPCEVALALENAGAGEILLNSIDRDGMKTGYDLELLRRVLGVVTVPVIVCGGTGRAEHLAEGMAAGASAAAAANFFHFTEHSAIVAKAILVARGVPVRLDTEASYAGCAFEPDTGRIAKRDSAHLHDLRFTVYKSETI